MNKFIIQKSKHYGIGIDFIPSQCIGLRFMKWGICFIWGNEIEIKMNRAGIE